MKPAFYIITPYRADYKRMCEENGLPYMNGSGVGGIYWINQVEKLYGHKIYPHDVIIRGAQYSAFGALDCARIETEIIIRTTKA